MAPGQIVTRHYAGDGGLRDRIAYGLRLGTIPRGGKYGSDIGSVCTIDT